MSAAGQKKKKPYQVKYPHLRRTLERLENPPPAPLHRGIDTISEEEHESEEQLDNATTASAASREGMQPEEDEDLKDMVLMQMNVDLREFQLLSKVAYDNYKHRLQACNSNEEKYVLNREIKSIQRRVEVCATTLSMHKRAMEEAVTLS